MSVKKAAANTRKPMAVHNDTISGPPKANPAGMSNPATRALLSIGVTKVSQLASHREQDVAELHGMGPKAIIALNAALKAQGKSFRK